MPVGLNENPVGLVDPACPVDWSHPLNRGLVSRWKVIPNSGWRGGLTFRDLVRGGKKPNDGTLINGPTWVGGGRRGGYGALNFVSTSSQRVDFSSIDSVISGIGKLSISAWCFRVAGKTCGFSKGQNNSTCFGISWFDDNTIYCLCNDGAGTFGSYFLNVSGWHHLQLVFDGSAGSNATRLRLFINGVNVSLSFSGTIPSVTPSGGASFNLGNPTASPQTGPSDDLCVYTNRTFADSEVSQLYQEQLRGSPETLRWVGATTYGFSEQAAATGGTPIFSSGILSSRIIGGGGIVA